MTKQSLAPVYLTTHAVQRFQERSRRALGVRYTDAKARNRIAGLLSKADVDQPDESFRRRILKMRAMRAAGADKKDVEYWRRGGWRFVIVRESPAWIRVLVTCERIAPGEN